MNPEQHMWNQWYQEQLYLNQIMGGSRISRRRSQGSSGQQAPSCPGQNQAAPSRSSRPSGGSSQGRRTTDGATPSASRKTETKPERTGQKIHPRTTKNQSQRVTASDQSMISLLRTTHSRLDGADHDYDGHRVKAIGHIAGALNDLGSSTPPGLIVGASSGTLAQSRSDEMLRTAVIQLRSAESSLSGGSGRTERHHRAREAVGRAIRELEMALRMR
jgi:hypothetical protein